MKINCILLSAVLCFAFVIESGCKKSDSTATRGGAVIVDAAGGLNMRKEPALNGEVVALVPNGSQVTVLEEKDAVIEIKGIKGKWTKISWNDKTGWAFGGFLKSGSSGSIGEVDEKEFIGKTCSFGEGPDGGSFTLQTNNTITGSVLLGGSGDAKINGTYTIAREGAAVKVTINGTVDTHSVADTETRRSDKVKNGQITIQKENGKYKGSSSGITNFSVFGEVQCE